MHPNNYFQSFNLFKFVLLAYTSSFLLHCSFAFVFGSRHDLKLLQSRLNLKQKSTNNHVPTLLLKSVSEEFDGCNLDRNIVEFSRPLELTELGKKHYRSSFEANAEECENLAKRLELVSLRSLTCKVDVHRLRDSPQLVQVTGSFSAEFDQKCRTTDRTFPNSVTDNFDTVILEQGDSSRKLSPEEMEMVDEEISEGGAIDLGEIVSQYLGLAIDLNQAHPAGNENIVWESSVESFDSSSPENQFNAFTIEFNTDNDDIKQNT